LAVTKAETFSDNNDYGKSTLRYPLQPPVMDQDFNGDSADSLTGKTDYLRIRRKKTVYNDGGKDYYGQNNFPRNTAITDYHKTIAYLAIPGGINAQYQPVYNQTNLGVGGMAALNTLQKSTDFSSAAAQLQQAAAAILPEFAAGAIAGGANAISGFLGVSGSLNANSFEALTEGRVYNPYIEQIFSQMNFRSHSFSFKMMARNVKEAREIQNIITYINVGAHPKVKGVSNELNKNLTAVLGSMDKNQDEETTKTKSENATAVTDIANEFTGNGGEGRFFGIPDQYELAFMRMSPKSGEFDNVAVDTVDKTGPTMNLHYKMDTCVNSGFSVNYTPDNQYTSLKRIDGNMIQVPAVIVQMNFTEVRLLNQSDIRAGF